MISWSPGRVTDRTKWIYSTLGARERLQRFDLEADPGESVDLSGMDAAAAERILRELLLRSTRYSEMSVGRESGAISDEMSETLRGLGYLK